MFNYRILKEILKADEIILYLRKSRSDDPLLTTEEVLEKHETILNEWMAKNLDATIPEENRFREVVSGESIADRPEFQKVLKLLESPKYKAVLVVEVSRLGRPDMEEIGKLSKIFRYTNTLVITPTMTFDIANEYERDMFERELKRGNEYLEYTKKLLRRGRELSVKSGNFVASRPVYGYDKIIVMEGKKRCPTLAINEEQANVVRMIFNWYTTENIGTQVIADRLNDMGFKSAEGVLFTNDGVRFILDNPTYMGKVRWNTRKGIHVVENGEVRKTRPKNKGEDVIYCEGKHEAIISEEVFQLAKEKRGRMHKAQGKKELRNPLSTILYCECGYAMSYTNSTRNKKPKGDPKLKCNRQKQCKNGSCTVDEIMPFIVEVLQKKIKEFEIEANSGNERSIKEQEKLIKNLEKKLADINARELSLWDAQIDPNQKTVPAHIFNAMTDKIEKERAETETALANAREVLNTPIDYQKKIVTLQAALDAILDEDRSVAEQNFLLKSCISRITYHRDATERALGKGSGKQWIHAPIQLHIEMRL